MIQVKACAICGSDIAPHFLASEDRGYVPGHEPAGVLTEIGGSVKDLAIGDSVAVNWVSFQRPSGRRWLLWLTG